MSLKLMKHQEFSVKFLEKHPIVFDTSDPGTGKTAVEIVAFAKHRKRGGKALLVIAPRSLLYSAWAADFNKFAPWLKVSVATAKNREEAFAVEADVYITNTDAVRWLAKQSAKFFFRFDTFVNDECTAFKHHTSLRSTCLRKIIKHFKFRRALTGTPATNGICDIWHQVFLLDDGKRLGKSFYNFRSAVCTVDNTGPFTKWVDKKNSEALVGSLIQDITIRHVFEECVDIPPNHRYTIPFELSKKHRAAYDEMVDKSIVVLERKSVTAINAAVQYGKLLQIASGAAYGRTDDDSPYVLIDESRYELVADLVEERQHSLVVFRWQHQRDELIKQLKGKDISYAVYDGSVLSDTKRAEIVEAFQQGAYRCLLVHPKSAGHGLTLVRATSTIWASPTPDLEHFIQANKRIYRIGQKKKTETIVVIGTDTIDEYAYERMIGKDDRLTGLLSFLRKTNNEPRASSADRKSVSARRVA